ncbi:MAG: peptidase S41 [Gemmatimonadales bacterium]|nr:peptidase S41 [Gemmatimonadales bacterium]
MIPPRLWQAALAAAVLSVGCAPALGTPIHQEIENLRAFAKLYGVVRYFHPSDEAAQLPWDAFAIHGAERVKNARDSVELKQRLEELFLPVAPTVQIYFSEESAPEPLVTPRADTSGLVTVAWQHHGLGLGAPSFYRSIRLNRENRVARRGGAGFGSVTQGVDAAPYRGKDVKLRAFVRADVTGSGNQGQLWLRVDRPTPPPGFFDNMDGRPITSQRWQAYEIVGHVAGDATMIFFGCFLAGQGTVWVDDFELLIRDVMGSWTPAEILNPGFEEVAKSGKPLKWSMKSPGYEYVVDRNDAHSGAGSLAITEKSYTTSDPLFDAWPRVGEAAEKVLGAGLSARIPLALYSDSNHTLGVSDTSAFTRRPDIPVAIQGDMASADREAVRLGGIVIAWNVLQHFYPYFDVVGADWDGQLTIAFQDALNDRDARDFHHTLKRFTATLNDGHARVFHIAFVNKARLPFQVDWVENQVVVVRSRDTTFMAGDVVLTIDGREATMAVAASEAEVSGSPQWKRVRAMLEFGAGDSGTMAALEVRRDGRTLERQAARVSDVRPTESNERTVREIEAGIWYVDLRQAEMSEIRKGLDELAAARGVIFDLRGYPNGNHEVLRHLLTSRDTSAAWMRVPQIIYPDRERRAGMSQHGWGLTPAEPHIGGQVVFLTDSRAISYAESFMSFVEHYELGEIVGQPTAGTNGNVNPFNLPGGFRISWTGMQVVKHDGSQHHLIGIQPTVAMERSIEGIRLNRDEYLEKALEIIRVRTTPP